MSKYRNYCFTWQDYPADFEEVIGSLKSGFIYQKEIGKKTGKEHLQGVLWFKNQISFEGIKKKLPGAHIEVCKNLIASKQYCSKADTAVPGSLRTSETQVVVKNQIRDPLEGFELKDWQLEICRLWHEEPDNRSIYWYWDKKGGCGKTSLAKSLCLRGETVYVSGKCNDIKYGLSSYLKEKKQIRMVIFDFVRSSESFVSYEAIETVKNGIFFNNKFESGMVMYNPPHVVIFSNFQPEKNKLSEDRWRIQEIIDPDTSDEDNIQTMDEMLLLSLT